MRQFLQSILDALWPQPTVERPSPKIRITPEQADELIQALRIIGGYEKCFIAALAPTNSMEPTLDDGMYAILDIRPHDELIPGDIIWYQTLDYQAIHRIVRIGHDGDWYCECKGDNNQYEDDIRVRAENVRGVWRATLD